MPRKTPRLRRGAIPHQEPLDAGLHSLQSLVCVPPGAIEPRLQMQLERIEPLVAQIVEMTQVVPQTLAEAMARTIGAINDPLSAAFAARCLNGVAQMTAALSQDVLSEAVGEASDYAVLLRALGAPATIEALERSDPLAEARLRDLEQRRAMLTTEGGILTVEQVAQRLGVTRQAVDKRRRAHRVLALPVGQHRYVYPAWQFTASGMLAGVEEALAELSLPDPWTQAAFFLSENTYLDGQRPLDELRRGDIEAVRRAAWAMGEQGAA